MTNRTNTVSAYPVPALIELYQRNGCLRAPNPERRREDPNNYKKGYEIRWIVATKREVAEIRRLLRRVGFKPGKAFRKRAGWVQPVYGRQAVERFQMWLETFG